MTTTFSIDYPYSINFLNQFWSDETERLPEDISSLREGLAGYPELLKTLHGIEIDLCGKIDCKHVNKLVFCLNQERIEFGEVIERMHNLLGIFQPQSFRQLCELSRDGLAQVFKQLAIHPQAMISHNHLEEYCLLLSRFEDLRSSDIPRTEEEQQYLQNIRERYFTALAIYHVICHGQIESREDFTEKFEEVARYQQEKRIAELEKLQKYIESAVL